MPFPPVLPPDEYRNTGIVPMAVPVFLFEGKKKRGRFYVLQTTIIMFDFLLIRVYFHVQFFVKYCMTLCLIFCILII